jgi:hypothetical protein
MAIEVSKNDALGNDIVMGQSYGYSNTTSGITRVVTGIAETITKSGKVSLIVTGVVQYVYGGSPSTTSYDKDKVAVYGCHLFPIPTKV